MQDHYHKISSIKGSNDTELHFTNWLGRCCGLYGLSNFLWFDERKTKEEWKKWYKDTLVPKTTETGGYDTENFHFVVTSAQLKTAKAETGELSLLAYFVQDPRFKVVYTYKQNAHGYHKINICMFHGRPDEVKL
jgi:hypothetical protein